MEPKEIYEALKKQFPKAMLRFEEAHGEPFVVVSPEDLPRVARFLKEESSFQFNSLMSVSGVDHGEEMAVVYHLCSLPRHHRIVLKTMISKEKLSVPTLERIWSIANWFERETFDLLGIEFEGHSDLRRILLPEDWVGHPLRKDYEYPEEYDGIKLERL